MVARWQPDHGEAVNVSACLCQIIGSSDGIVGIKVHKDCLLHGWKYGLANLDGNRFELDDIKGFEYVAPEKPK